MVAFVDRGERDEVRKRLLDLALRATQLAEVADHSDTTLSKMLSEVRALQGQIALLETLLRASRTPDDETMA